MVTMSLACAIYCGLHGLVGLEPPPDPDPAEPSATADRPAPDRPSPYRTEVVSGRDRGDGLAAQRRASRRNVGFVSAIDLDSLPTRPRGDELAEVVSRAPGVTVRSLGGLGQFSAISIRGSSSQQVPVFLDGAPLTGSMSSSVDLSSQPLDTLARVEIYRGYVPVRFGAAAIGGAMDLVGRVHRGPTRLWAAAGFGSFLAREARLGLGARLRPDLSVALRAGYAGSRGDFRYFDDGQTPAVPDDDGFARRRNNAYDRALVQLRFDLARPRLRLSEQLSAWWKDQGVPGTTTSPSTSARQRSLVGRAVTRARVDLSQRPDRPAHAEWLVSLAVEDRVFRDRDAELGLTADDEHALTLDGWLSPRLRTPLWPMAWLELVASVRGERIAIDERILDGAPANDASGGLSSGDATRTRLSLGVGAELEQWLFDRRWALVAGVRLDFARSRFAVLPDEGELDDGGRDRLTLALTPRAGTKVRLAEGLDLRASVGRYLRVPTLYELFGDRGYTVGNEALRPEQGTKVDGGLSFDGRELGGRPISLFAELAGYATWTRDLIQWVRSGPVVRPVNVSGARVAGLEAGLSLRAFGRDLGLDLAYTFLDSHNLSPEAEQRGKPLPGRPAHSLLARPSTGHALTVGPRATVLEPRLFYELEWVAGTFLDLSGRVELPARLLHAAGISLTIAERVELRVEGRNLGNRLVAEIDPSFGPPLPYRAAISDFIGFPLPGISVWTSVRVFILPKPKPSEPRP